MRPRATAVVGKIEKSSLHQSRPYLSKKKQISSANGGVVTRGNLSNLRRVIPTSVGTLLLCLLLARTIGLQKSVRVSQSVRSLFVVVDLSKIVIIGIAAAIAAAPGMALRMRRAVRSPALVQPKEVWFPRIRLYFHGDTFSYTARFPLAFRADNGWNSLLANSCSRLGKLVLNVLIPQIVYKTELSNVISLLLSYLQWTIGVSLPPSR
jgi:hypothetical protein